MFVFVCTCVQTHEYIKKPENMLGLIFFFNSLYYLKSIDHLVQIFLESLSSHVFRSLETVFNTWYMLVKKDTRNLLVASSNTTFWLINYVLKTQRWQNMKGTNNYQTLPSECFQARSRFTVVKLLIPLVKGWRLKKSVLDQYSQGYWWVQKRVFKLFLPVWNEKSGL